MLCDPSSYRYTGSHSAAYCHSFTRTHRRPALQGQRQAQKFESSTLQQVPAAHKLIYQRTPREVLHTLGCAIPRLSNSSGCLSGSSITCVRHTWQGVRRGSKRGRAETTAPRAGQCTRMWQAPRAELMHQDVAGIWLRYRQFKIFKQNGEVRQTMTRTSGRWVLL